MGDKGRNIDRVTFERPDPPKDLTPEQKEIWVHTVNEFPVDWFGPSTLPLLREYVCVATSAARARHEIRKFEERDRLDVKNWQNLIRQANALNKSLVLLATKMRLCQSTKFNRDRSRGKPSKGGPKPWDTPDGGKPWDKLDE